MTTTTTTDTEPAPEPAASPPASRHRVRGTFAWILLVLGALLVGISSVAVWAARTVVNEDRFNTLVSNVVSDPGVISATSAYITTQAQTAVVNSGVIEQLPPTWGNLSDGRVATRQELPEGIRSGDVTGESTTQPDDGDRLVERSSRRGWLRVDLGLRLGREEECGQRVDGRVLPDVHG